MSDTRIHPPLPKHPEHPLNTGYTTPTRCPYPIQCAQLSGKVDECKPLVGGPGNQAVTANEPALDNTAGRGLHSSTSQLNLSRF